MSSPEEIWTLAEDNAQLIADAANDIVQPIPLPDPEHRWIWLTMNNCGFACEVLRQVLEKEGIAAQAISNYDIRGKYFEGHAILEVENGDKKTYIDPTYLQLFGEFGLDSWFAATMIENGLPQTMMLPEDRSLVFTNDNVDEVIDWMMGQTRFMLRRWQLTKYWLADGNARPELQPTDSQMKEFFARAYDLSAYKPYEQTEEKQRDIAEYLKDYEPDSMSIDALLRYVMRRNVVSKPD